MRKRCIAALLAVLLLGSIFTPAAMAANYAFTDRYGNQMEAPVGAFATRVVSFVPGDPWTKDEDHMDPKLTLGIPDYDSKKDKGDLTLGAGGVLVLEFNIGIVDGEGDDIYVFETGPQVEDTKVEVSSDLTTWYEAGVAQGKTAGVDLRGKVPAEGRFRYVRLTDLKAHGSGTYPGADIDAVSGLNFKAVTSGWAQDEIDRAEELGLIPEVLENTDLTLPVSRLEFAAISVKVYESLNGTKALPSTINPFVDCSDLEVLKAYNVGITKGVSPIRFDPDSLLTREQAATMLTRVFKRCTIPGWTLDQDSEFSLSYDEPPLFKDDKDISGWAKESVYFMAANGIINGMSGGRFVPKNRTTEEEARHYANATREQALAIAVRMVENL